MNAVRRMALLSIATSIGTIALKFGAYFLTSSVSLWSDALESLVNLAAGLVAMGALTLAAQPADDRHAYGHDKAEYFSSGVEGALIMVAAAAIVVSAVPRLIEPMPLERLGPGILVAIVAGATIPLYPLYHVPWVLVAVVGFVLWRRAMGRPGWRHHHHDGGGRASSGMDH